VEELILVLGHQAQQLIPLISQLPDAENVRVVINPRYEEGQFSSLQAGIQAVELSRQGVLLCLIDQPHLKVSTYQTIVQEARQSPKQIVIPSHRSRWGHPVYLPRWLFGDILHQTSPCTLRDLVSRHRHDVLTRELNDPGVREDVDTKEDLERLEKVFG
jgi:CTP:molybdopterin cytidylyltransferase MocA